MAETFLGKAEIYGFGSAAMDVPDLVGYVSPQLTTADIEHQGAVREVRNQSGQLNALIIADDDTLTWTINFIPQAGTRADALKSAWLPPIGARIKITGMPVVKIGSFADAFNADTTNPWIYEGDGRINCVSNENWTATLKCRRFKNIASATQIS